MWFHVCFRGGAVVKNPPANAGDVRDMGLIPGSKKIPWRRAWQPTPVFLPGESHGHRNQMGYSPGGCKELNTSGAATHTCVHAWFQEPVGLTRTVYRLTFTCHEYQNHSHRLLVFHVF